MAVGVLRVHQRNALAQWNAREWRPFSDSSPTKRRRAWSSARSQTACPVATARCSTSLTWATKCAETEPEQSCHTTQPVWGHDRTWKEEQTNFICDCKHFVLCFFLRICTGLILGLGPQTKPPSMTVHHGLVTSQCLFWVTLQRTIILFRETGVPELNLDRELHLAAIKNPV